MPGNNPSAHFANHAIPMRQVEAVLAHADSSFEPDNMPRGAGGGKRSGGAQSGLWHAAHNLC